MCASGPTWRDSLSKRILLDNGAYEIKYSNASELKPQTMFNAVGKDKKSRSVYSGNKLLEELENGHIRNRFAELVFEDFEFDALLMSSTHSMIREAALSENPVTLGGAQTSQQQCEFIVDSGFSFTYGVPFFNGKPLKFAATRIDVGGKLLTNLLNEVLSYKEINLQGETYLVNNIKEQLCFVSTNFPGELEVCQNPFNDIAKEYVLPDYRTTKKGLIRDPVVPQRKDSDQEEDNQAKMQINTSTKVPQNQVINFIEAIIKVNNERFTIPEILFNPSDIGICEAGIPEMISQSIAKCPPVMERQLFKNIIISGGNTLLPGFKDRLEKDLQLYKPDNDTANVYELYKYIFIELSNPLMSAWKGLRQFCQNRNNFEEFVVTRREYQEEGFRVLRKFYL